MTESSGPGHGACILGSLFLQKAGYAVCSLAICSYLRFSSFSPPRFLSLILQIPVDSESPFCLW